MNRREAGLENWPDLRVTQLQPAAEHPAASQPDGTPGAIPELQTLTSTQEAGAEHTLSKQAGDRKAEGSREERAHIGNGSTSTNINIHG